jgi:hypothetical protein
MRRHPAAYSRMRHCLFLIEEEQEVLRKSKRWGRQTRQRGRYPSAAQPGRWRKPSSARATPPHVGHAKQNTDVVTGLNAAPDGDWPERR